VTETGSRITWPLAATAGAVVLAVGLATAPLVTAGVFLGLVLLLVTLARPLWVLGFMLAIGAVDLSFVTGGRLLDDWWGIDMNGMRRIAMVIAMAAIIILEPRATRHAFGPRARWYVLFLLYGGATIAFSILPLDGARLLLKLAYPLLLFLAVLAVARRRSDLERLADWALAGGAATAVVLVPLLLLLGQYEFDVGGRLTAPGVALHQNPLSFYMLIMALLAFARFGVRGQKRYLVLAGIFGLWIVLTLTRITLLATVAAFAAVALYNAWRERNLRLPLAAAAVVLLVGIPLAPIALERTFGAGFGVADLWSLARDPVELFHRMNLQGREIVWPVVLQAFLANPVLGMGLGSSTYFAVAILGQLGGGVVHNEYLRLAADTGLIGLVLFTAAIATWLAAAIRAGREPGLIREFAVPAGAGIIAWAIISLTDNPFDYYASFTQYIALAVAGSVALMDGAADPMETEDRQRPEQALVGPDTRPVAWEGAG
jgi:O-antigen ligase